MSTVLQRIQESADKRLPLSTSKLPAQELTQYRRYLEVEKGRLRIQHRAGIPGMEVCHAQAWIMDLLLKYIFESVLQHFAKDKPEKAELCLVAIGGYGRGELNPRSDIDFMFLHSGPLISRGNPSDYLKNVIDGILYPLWDLGLKVGHSCRSIADCVQVANTDMQSKTSLLEARPIAGDEVLFGKMHKTFIRKCVKGHERAYIQQRLSDQSERRKKYGNSPYRQEPNIKNGCGGLRDYQNLLWMVFFKYQTGSTQELVDRDLISKTERRQLDTAYEFLLRVRNEMHYLTNRPIDILDRNIQPEVLFHLGYTERSKARRIEMFMEEFFAHTRNIYLLSRILEQRLALLPQPRSLPTISDVIQSSRLLLKPKPVDGLQFVGGYIKASSSRIFREQPRRLMRVFLHAKNRNLPLHPDLEQLIRNSLRLVDRQFLTDEHVHQTFLEIIGHRGNVAPVLRMMHEVGFLGKYIPEFGKLTCKVQHEFYHQYTVDEHTLVCIEELDTVWDAEKAPYSHYREIFRQLDSPSVLYLALLLHDAGKAEKGKNHSKSGIKLARRVAERMGLPEYEIDSLCILVEHHLLMAVMSQRKDLDDPDVIKQFAGAVISLENLKMLAVLTFVDSQATSKTLWNSYKETLLWTLFKKAKIEMTEAVDFLEIAAEKQRHVKKQVLKNLPENISTEEVTAHFQTLPPRYFRMRSPLGIIEDLNLVHRFIEFQLMEQDRALEPAIFWRPDPDRDSTVLRVCTWDRGKLFSDIVGSVTAAGLNILDAQVFSRNDGIILDRMIVVDELTGHLPKKSSRDLFEKILKGVLKGNIDLKEVLDVQLKESRSKGPAGVEAIQTSITFDNNVSERRTVMEVQAEDHPGLLFEIACIFNSYGLDLSLARVITEKGAAIDTFYLKEPDGTKISTQKSQDRIRNRIKEAINRLASD
ncbi:MAG TPA: [protein-PII] uridylyltransferase [Verrucomicrobiales bacterium]|nr:[protein-PII] uridylyltransferase [Verrucomicrobiales bacterium]